MALSFYVMGIRSLAQLLSSGPRCLLSMMGAKKFNVQYSNTASAWRACIYMHISNTMPKEARTMHELNYTVYTYTYFYVCIQTHRTHTHDVYIIVYIHITINDVYVCIHIYIHLYIYVYIYVPDTRGNSPIRLQPRNASHRPVVYHWPPAPQPSQDCGRPSPVVAKKFEPCPARQGWIKLTRQIHLFAHQGPMGKTRKTCQNCLKHISHVDPAGTLHKSTLTYLYSLIKHIFNCSSPVNI